VDLLEIKQIEFANGVNTSTTRKVVYASKVFRGTCVSGLPCEGLDAVVKPPNIKEMISRDLWSVSRLDALYSQAIEQDIIRDSPEMPVLWIAAALVSRLDKVRPVLTFSVIVGNGSWYLIPEEFIKWADKILRHHQE